MTSTTARAGAVLSSPSPSPSLSHREAVPWCPPCRMTQEAEAMLRTPSRKPWAYRREATRGKSPSVASSVRDAHTTGRLEMESGQGRLLAPVIRGPEQVVLLDSSSLDNTSVTALGVHVTQEGTALFQVEHHLLGALGSCPCTLTSPSGAPAAGHTISGPAGTWRLTQRAHHTLHPRILFFDIDLELPK